MDATEPTGTGQREGPGTAANRAQAQAATQRKVRLWLAKQVFFLLLLAVTLFWSAGRLDWRQGWLQFGLYVLVVAAQALLLIPRSPELIAERSGYQKGTRNWDLAVTGAAAAVLPMAAWVIAGLDERHGWSPELPLWAEWIAAAVWLAGYALTIYAMSANAYFSATVRIQDDRGQTVATDGPYRWVRHPGYVGAITFQLATPFMLGSLWALLPSLLSAALYVLRTALEDRTLQRELAGYVEYARRVRYRLVPGLW